ncbi:MAG: methylmalonyl-CoA epimerase [Alphaproteobacteria bacterium]|tara:strand:+ start:86 stop:490 length:405 start_codon:yes stop_codon:yes gene_type:complete
MITKFNHVAIVVPNLEEAANKYKRVLGANVSKTSDYPEHGVSVVFVELENTKIELMFPYGENSPIKNFLDKNKNGSIHHICIEVENIDEACKKMEENGVRILGSNKPKKGAHDKPVIFLHPKDFYGTLIELEQA